MDIRHHTPSVSSYDDAIVTPTVINRRPNRSISGCLYDEHGRVIPASQRFGGHMGDHFPTRDTASISIATLPGARVLSGRTLYLGHYMSHYGHFLLETLSTFWNYENMDAYDQFLFHPFVFGSSLVPFAQACFDAFCIPVDRIMMVEEAMRLDHVTIPERLVKPNKSVNLALRRVYRHLSDTYSQGGSGRKYYVSRVRNSMTRGIRIILNEVSIEDYFEKHGFEVVYPETLTLPQQVALFQSADVVAGLSGSGLHNCLFMRPGTSVLEIGDSRTPRETHPMQKACYAIADVAHHLLPFSGRIVDRKTKMCVMHTNKLFDSAHRELQRLASTNDALDRPPDHVRAKKARSDIRTYQILRTYLFILARGLLGMIRNVSCAGRFLSRRR